MGESKQQRLWTPTEVATRILEGDTIVIHQGRVLRITPAWLSSHPGGSLAILHFVGRDATDEVNAFHSEAALERMKGFVVGKVEIGEKGWQPFIPPVETGWVRRRRENDGQFEWYREAEHLRDSTTLDSGLSFNPHNHSPSEIHLLQKSQSSSKVEDKPVLESITPSPPTVSPETQTKHSLAYRELHARVTAAGLYQTRYIAGYGPEFLRYFFLGACSYALYSRGWFFTSALLLGMLWHQLTFIAHDLGHNGVTHNWVIDRLLGILIADTLGGLSIGWWVDNHNIHHLVPNHPSHDPDIQHIPFFAISPAFLQSLYSSYYGRLMSFDGASKFLLSIQHKIYYFVMSLARFNLYANSYAFLWKTRHKSRWTWWAELAGCAVYWSWYLRAVIGCGRWQTSLGYLLITHMVASPLHVQIVLSHFSRSTADLGPFESFVHRQLRTTTDVICSDSIAFLHGGLHLQVTHHLFPRLPRHNLRTASLLVKQFCKERGVEYHEFGFVEGNQDVQNVLREVANQVRIVKRVASAEIDKTIKDGLGVRK